jgi:hypothetical protein
MSILFTALAGVILATTILHGGDWLRPIKEFGPVISLCLLADYCAKKEILGVLLKAMSNILIIWLMLNLITMIYYPDGLMTVVRGVKTLSKNWFLGWQKRIGFYAFPAFTSSILYSRYKFGKLFTFRFYLLLSIAAYSLLRVWAVTTIVTTAIFLILILITRYKPIRYIINPYSLIIICYIWFLGIVIFRLQYLFSGIITSLLHKDLTFTGRIYLWDEAIQYFLQRPIFGSGFQNYIELYGATVESAHSFYLDILVEGGLVCFCIFLKIQKEYLKAVYPYRHESYGRSIYILSFVIMFQVVTDPAVSLALYVPLILAQYIPNIKLEEECHLKKRIPRENKSREFNGLLNLR